MAYYIRTKHAEGDVEVNDDCYDTLVEAAHFAVYEGDCASILTIGGWWVIQCFQIVDGVEVDCTEPFKKACFEEWEIERYEPPQIILDMVEEKYTMASGEWDLINGDIGYADDNRLDIGSVM